MSVITTYNRNIVPNPPGSGITINDLLFQNGTVGTTKTNLTFQRVTSAATTPVVLTNLSPQTIYVDGTAVQYFVVPDATTLANGQTFKVINRSSQTAAVVVKATAITTSGTLPLATIDVTSTTGFSSPSGTLIIGSTFQVVSYTGTTATSFTGCTGGTGSISVGDVVAQSVINYVPTTSQTNVVCMDNSLPTGFGSYLAPSPVLDSADSPTYPTNLTSTGPFYGNTSVPGRTWSLSLGNNTNAGLLGTAGGVTIGNSMTNVASATVTAVANTMIGFVNSCNNSSLAIGVAASSQVFSTVIGRVASSAVSDSGYTNGRFAIGQTSLGENIGYNSRAKCSIGASTASSGVPLGEFNCGYGTFSASLGGIGAFRGFNLGFGASCTYLYCASAGYLSQSYNGVALGWNSLGRGGGGAFEPNGVQAIGYNARAQSPSAALSNCVIGRDVTRNASSLYAWSLNVNANSTPAGVMGITLLGQPRQMEMYSSLYTAVAMSGTPLVLTGTSAKVIHFTGATNQIVTLPVSTSVGTGCQFRIVNRTSGTNTVLVRTSALTTVVTVQPGNQTDVICIDSTGATGINGWYSAGTIFSQVSTALPALIQPNNYTAALKNVLVGGLYRTAYNTAATLTTTFAITASFVTTGTTLTVTATAGTIVPGMFLTGGGVLSGTQILSGPGGVGSYTVDTSNTAGTAPTDVLFSNNTTPDEILVRSA